MARKRKRKKHEVRHQRDIYTPKPIAKPRRLLRRSVALPSRLRRRIPDDRREFRPLNQEPKDIYGRYVRYQLAHKNLKGKSYRSTRARLQFKNPYTVPICKRRRERRETLFATGRAGNGVRGPEKRILNEYSNVRC